MVRVAAVALNVRLAQPAYNARFIRESIMALGYPDLWVGSELALSGRWCGELFGHADMIDACWSEMETTLLPLSVKCCLVVGMPVRDGARLYIGRVVLQEGRVQGIFCRDPVGEETRWFRPCHALSFNNIPILKGSYAIGKGDLSLGLHWDCRPLKAHEKPVSIFSNGTLSVGNLGCEGDLRWVMPGVASITDFEGHQWKAPRLCTLEPWSACVAELDISHIHIADEVTVAEEETTDTQLLIDGIVLWLRDAAAMANASGFQVALSGGIDSGCVALLIAELRERVPSLGLHTAYLKGPGSSRESEERASQLAQTIGSEHVVIQMDTLLNAISEQLTGCHWLGNATARLRMVLTYALAQQSKQLLLVVGSANADEGRMGYFTKWDASAADLNPLASLSKQDIRRMVAHLARGRQSVNSLLTAIPSAELWPGQTDEAEMGITYEQLGRLGRLHHLGPQAMKDAGEDPDLVDRYWQRWWANRHKADAIPAALQLQ